MSQTYVLTLSCPDQPGIVHAVSGQLLGWGGNIEEAAQYNDTHTGLFFMRVQFSCDATSMDDMRAALIAFGEPWHMQTALYEKAHRMPTILMVSKQGHCLNDLLFRWKTGLLDIDLRGIISNHRDFYQLAASYNVPFPRRPRRLPRQNNSGSLRKRALSWWFWRATCRCYRMRCAVR